jgi:hypothetical protein
VLYLRVVLPAEATSTKQIRTVPDFSRHRRDLEVTCYCEHKGMLDFRHVAEIFSRKVWSIGLDSAVEHFRSSKCGIAPACIRPQER